MFKHLVILLIFSCFFAHNSQSQTVVDSIYQELETVRNLEDQNRFGASLKKAHELLEKAKQIKNDSLVGSLFLAIAINNTLLGDDEGGLEYLNKSRKIFLKQNDSIGVALVNNNISIYYSEKGQHKTSIKYLKESLRILQNANSPRVIFPLSNLGYDYAQLKNYKLALFYLNESSKYLALNKEDQRLKCDILLNKAKAYLGLKNQAKFLAFLNQAIHTARVNNYFGILQEVYKIRAEHYYSKGDYKKAVEDMLIESVSRDSFDIRQEANLAKEIELKYEKKENKERLSLIKKEQLAQKKILKTSNYLVFILFVLAIVLISASVLLIKKNKDLKRAKLNTERASKMKASFYSEVSHELRTPLYAVIELSNLLLEKNKNLKDREYLESLQFSGTILLALINNVLEQNKIESGKNKLKVEEFNLKNLVENIIESLAYALKFSANEIQLNYDDAIPNYIIGDSLKLSQILINIIANAIKFTNKGCIIVDITERVCKNNTCIVDFKIKDNGYGIPKDKQAYIFSDFYTVDSQNKRNYVGTGLGLSIVKKSLELMGSDISFESIEGQGTTFMFSIQFKIASKNRAVALTTNKLTEVYNFKILIVDDNKINQLVTKRILEPYFEVCDVVGSGQEAIDALKKTDYNCIVMDLYMPLMDGFETSSIIRTFNTTVAIIALTAANPEEVLMHFNDSGLDDFVLKPFKTSMFVKKIIKYITLKQPELNT